MNKPTFVFCALLLFYVLFFMVLPQIGVLEFIGYIMWTFLYVGIPAAIIISVFVAKR